MMYNYEGYGIPSLDEHRASYAKKISEGKGISPYIYLTAADGSPVDISLTIEEVEDMVATIMAKFPKNEMYQKAIFDSVVFSAAKRAIDAFNNAKPIPSLDSI